MLKLTAFAGEQTKKGLFGPFSLMSQARLRVMHPPLSRH